MYPSLSSPQPCTIQKLQKRSRLSINGSSADSTGKRKKKRTNTENTGPDASSSFIIRCCCSVRNSSSRLSSVIAFENEGRAVFELHASYCLIRHASLDAQSAATAMLQAISTLPCQTRVPGGTQAHQATSDCQLTASYNILPGGQDFHVNSNKV